MASHTLVGGVGGLDLVKGEGGQEVGSSHFPYHTLYFLFSPPNLVAQLPSY